MTWRAAALLWATLAFAEDEAGPWIDRVVPLSGQRGTTVQIELHGTGLAKVDRVGFHTRNIEWIATESASEKKVVGTVRIASGAALGPHVAQANGAGGPTNSRLFNVTQFKSVAESEPNDLPRTAQEIALEPQSIQGYMQGLIDVDHYAFDARAGERWVFDLRSLEYGTHLEAELVLLDANGKRVAMNDDRDDYDESPLLEHTFAASGRHYLKLDQYRGPQGVTCARNCGYSLEISRLPVIRSVYPLGARRGSRTTFHVGGSGIEAGSRLYLTLARSAEHYRMTYPFTMPIRFAPDPPDAASTPRIDVGEHGRVDIPRDAPLGLWRLWIEGPPGVAPSVAPAGMIEIGDAAEFDEAHSEAADWRKGPVVINGMLRHPGEEDRFRVMGVAGKALRVWTLAAQLGMPEIDTVVEVRDASGKRIAEHDDVMSGQGTPVGNPDSSVVFAPAADGPLEVSVRDRTGRGGPGYAYRLKIASEQAGFQLLTSPENFAAPRGGEAKLTVSLIREPGFEGEVPVWFENLPAGVTAETGKFRADQAFGPSADGDNMIIPELLLTVRVAADAPLGPLPLKLFGKGGPDGRVVAAHTSLWIGPPRYRNDIRRPRPAVTLTVLPAKP